MTKYIEDRSNRPADTPIVAGAEEWYAESRPPYICDTCHTTLSKLSDRIGLNISWYCSRCNVEYDPETELRTKSKLSMSEGATKNPGVSYAPEIGIKRKNKEPKGTFKNLQDRGLKITNYSEKGWRKTTYD